MTGGGADYSFECVGNTEIATTALQSCSDGWGMTVTLGVPKVKPEVSAHYGLFLSGKSLKGTLFGGWKPKSDLPSLIDKYMNKILEKKVVYSACEIAYKGVASRLDSAYKSILENDFVGMKAQHNQALMYIEICVKKSNFFPRTPIVGVNYNARYQAKIASIAGHMLAPSTTSST